MNRLMNVRTPALLRGRGGFTAIEVMVVLLIVAITTAIAAPALDGYVEQTRSRRALDQVVGDLAFTRMLAVSEGRRAAVRFDAGGVYRIQSQAADGSWTTRRSVDLQTEYGDAAFAGLAAVEFSSRGLVTNLTGESTVKITVGGARDSMYVSPVGRTYRAF